MNSTVDGKPLSRVIPKLTIFKAQVSDEGTANAIYSLLWCKFNLFTYTYIPLITQRITHIPNFNLMEKNINPTYYLENFSSILSL